MRTQATKLPGICTMPQLTPPARGVQFLYSKGRKAREELGEVLGKMQTLRRACFRERTLVEKPW